MDSTEFTKEKITLMHQSGERQRGEAHSLPWEKHPESSTFIIFSLTSTWPLAIFPLTYRIS